MTKSLRFILIFIFIGLYLLTRIPKLDRDIINPDAVNWHYRSQQFVVALKSGQWANTYQHYHPGVTLMWISGTAIELTKQLMQIKTYTHINFPIFDFIVKYFLVYVQLIVSLTVLYLLSKIIGFPKALLTIFILTFEPFFVGNSRLFHMDVIFTLFTFASLLAYYLFYRVSNSRYLVIASFFAGLAFLTRSIGIVVFLFSLSTIFIRKAEFKLYLRSFVINLFVFVATVFILFPALWVKPVFTISNIFSEGERVGVRKGHPQIILGEEATNAGFSFYPLVLLLKSSPFLILCVASYFLFLVRAKKNNLFKQQISILNSSFLGLVSFLAVFYVGYFLMMSFPTKKIDRYMLTLFPFFALIASLAIYEWYLLEKNKKFVVSFYVVSFLIFSAYGILRTFPYNFTYTSLNPIYADKLIAQKSFGVGIYEVKDYILSHYGEVGLGFYDVKPIESIYPNSKVVDAREIGPGKYDLLVLTLHEDFNLKTGKNFQKKHSIFINGLEYWRIYEKI